MEDKDQYEFHCKINKIMVLYKRKTYVALVNGIPTYIVAESKKNALTYFRCKDPNMSNKDIERVKTTMTRNSSSVEETYPELFK